MKNYKQLIKELPSKSVVMAFGRFNPPTTGHELLIKAVKKLAQQRSADHVIYASRSQDAKKNPLNVDKKVKYLNLMFKNTHFAAANENVRTFIEAAKELNKKYKNLVMVAGSDRVPEFKRILNQYNGKDFHFDTIDVISAGERDPDADDATGMSASKMRAIAVKGNYDEFKKGLPTTVREIDGRRLMNDIRNGMGLEPIKEHVVLVKDELREKYFRGEVFNEGDIVESAGDKYTIIKRGSNHLLLREHSTNELTSKWIHDVNPTEEKDMNEELTDKTLKANDKIKVARMIATMLGVDNAESSSNPENLVNQALRKVRTKALNPEALSILDKMLALATNVGINYDATLKPTKLKEDKVNKSSKRNIAKDVMRFNDFNKIQKMNEHEEPDADDKKDNESDHDYEHNTKQRDPTEVGHTLVGPGKEDNLRRRKVKYHLGEQNKPEHIDMTSYGDEAGHENTAQHIVTDPEHNAKQKKLAKSFIDKMTSSVSEAAAPGSAALKLAKALQKEKEKRQASEERAKLMLSQKKEKEDLSAEHQKEREKLKEELEDIEDNSIDLSAYDVTQPGEYEEISDAEIEHLINQMTDDDYLDAYEEDELAVVDDETGEEIEPETEEDQMQEAAIMEVLSRVERMKAAARIRRTKSKRERATKIALKRYSNTKTINKRSRRLAIKLMKKRLLRGRDPSKLSVGEKERIERTIQKRKNVIGRIAVRLAPRVRKIEKARLSHSKYTQGNSNVAF